MISRRAFVTLAGAGLLAGCVATQPQHHLSLDLVQSFKFAGIEGRVDPEVRGVWLSMKDDFLKSKGIVIPQPDNENPGGPLKEVAMPPDAEFKAFLSREFNERARKVFAEPLAQELKGTRPVKVITTLHAVNIPPYWARLFKQLAVGRQGDQNSIGVGFEVVDAKSGQSLVRSAPIGQLGVGGEYWIDMGGPRGMFNQDPMVRMLSLLQPQFSDWLLKRAAG